MKKSSCPNSEPSTQGHYGQPPRAGLKWPEHSGCTDESCKREESSCQLVKVVHTWHLVDIGSLCCYTCPLLGVKGGYWLVCKCLLMNPKRTLDLICHSTAGGGQSGYSGSLSLRLLRRVLRGAYAATRVHHASWRRGGRMAARRRVAAGLNGCAASVCFSAGLADDPDVRARAAAFVQGLAQLGWTDGRNVRIDYRWGEGIADRRSQIRGGIGRCIKPVALPPGCDRLSVRIQFVREVAGAAQRDRGRRHLDSWRPGRGTVA